MKKISILSFLLLIGCTNQTENMIAPGTSATDLVTNTELTTDDVIAKSDSIACALQSETENTDKTITNKIATDKQKIITIAKELVAVKSENEILKDQVTKVKTVIIKDTVFINESKNFWGKKKTTVKDITDSTSSEEITE